ncbi:MAG: hypothetical protein QNJ55_35330 [Xenococcus sp. MO_188.B8]|nr:hypothetical protein [Xenococcus sp. MO_188.B8]
MNASWYYYVIVRVVKEPEKNKVLDESDGLSDLVQPISDSSPFRSCAMID